MDRTSRLTQFTFTLLATILLWQFDLPKKYGEFARYLGAEPSSIIYSVFLDFGIPFSLVVFAWLVDQGYEILWRLSPYSSSKGGTWIYSLIAGQGKKRIEVVGYFYLHHSIGEAKVIHGRAFYFNSKNRLSPRGEWRSDSVDARGDDLKILFRMRSNNPKREPIAANYDGFADLRRNKRTALYRGSVWEGYFYDLGDRIGISGPLYAERITTLRFLEGASVEDFLESSGSRFLRRTKALVNS